ncbi:MAG: tRNA (adenosine(37)-N6)-threonylcarbamoyltransferase complex dimerization subunit type 1 TsaB [Pyrinomonadaceae bacterium]
MRSASEVIISIEAGILGGSVSIRTGGRQFSYSGGADSSPEAELLLPKIDDLMYKAAASPKDVKQIIVSAGPGSFTGIRIGIATALGFASAVGATLRKIPLLPAMASAADGVVCSSVPVGRGMFASQIFDVAADSIVERKPAFLHSSIDELQASIGDIEIGQFVSLRDTQQASSTAETVEIDNLAEQLILAASDPRILGSEPIFLSKPGNV